MLRSLIIWLLLPLAALATNTVANLPPGKTLQAGYSSYSRCPNLCLGEQGLEFTDSDATHAVQRRLQAGLARPLVRFTLDPLTNDYTLNDERMALNANCNIILEWGIDAGGIINSNTQSNAVATVLSHYGTNIWGIDVLAESSYQGSSNATNFVNWLRPTRRAIDAAGYKGAVLLCGPNLDHLWISELMSNVVMQPFLTNIDVIAAHYYSATRGNGVTDFNGTVIHPNDAEGGAQNIPNLPGQLAVLHWWAQQCGATNLVIVEEGGFDNGWLGTGNMATALADARSMAMAFKTNNAVLIITAPITPNSIQTYSHGTNGVFDATVEAFLNQLCPGAP